MIAPCKFALLHPEVVIESSILDLNVLGSLFAPLHIDLFR